MEKNKTNIHPVILLLIIGIGGFLAYRLVLLLIVVFVYAGYNASFFLDNLLAVGTISPVVTWGFFGLLAGAGIGVSMAIKKYKLTKKLLFYPVGILLLFVLVMGFVNKPASYASTFHTLEQPSVTQQNTQPQAYYTVRISANARTSASTKSRVAFVLPAGAEVEIVQRGFYDARHVEWVKIRYGSEEGYVSNKLISTNYRY